MSVRYLSVCSGIEAATVSWHPLGWVPVAFAEIEKFPSAVLAARYPQVPNWGDMTRFKEWPDAVIDLLAGGTPCQSFSVAGLRRGLADPRGNLMLTYLAILDRYRPTWMVWENVPGVLSSNKGRDFGAFLGALGELGYGWAYRSLDAQYFHLAQRRERVFVVGCLRSWERAAQVLFEPESLSGYPPPSRETGKGLAPTLSARTQGGGGLGTDFDCDGGLICLESGQANAALGDNQSPTLTCLHEAPIIAHALRADGFDASEDGTGRGTPLVPIYTLAIRGREGESTLEARTDGTANAVLTSNGGRGGIGVGAIAFAIQERAVSENADAGPDGKGFRGDGAAYTLEARSVPQAVAFRSAGDGAAYEMGSATAPLTTNTDPSANILVNRWAVRRLTPVECCRLQGFPDDYLDITYRGKPAADGPKYKALGNSMAVPCMNWLGERIMMVERMTNGAE